MELIQHFLEKNALEFPDKTAVVHDDLRASYDAINVMANRVARRLVSCGIGHGERVAVLLHNGIDYIASYFGALKAGAVFVSLNTETKADALVSLMGDIAPSALITSGRFDSLAAEACLSTLPLKTIAVAKPKSAWRGYPCSIESLDDIIASGDGSDLNREISPDDLACLIYTSGSTGVPKGAMLTHKNIVFNTRSICEYLSLSPSDIQMVVLPFFYVMGKSLLNTHFAAGGSIVINNRFAYTGSVIKQMIDEKVTGFSGVPSTYAYLLHRSPLSASRDKLESLRYCSQAGGHMSRRIKEDLRNALPEHTEIYIMYGATEASARLSYLEPSMFDKKIESIGRAIPGVTLRIIDENGNELGPGETGELTASGPNIMRGYWNDPLTSGKVLDKWGYHTGDIAAMDEDGYFYLVGRKDNMLKVNGHKVNPHEIEDVLMASGFLVEAAVVGLPDALKGVRLVGVAVPIDPSCGIERIENYSSQNLPGFKAPDSFVFARALPKKASGKIDRTKCAEIAAAKDNQAG